MTDGGNERVGANHYMVSDINFSDVEYSQVEIASEVIADKDVFAAVATEGLGYPYSFTDAAQHFFQIVIDTQIFEK